MTDESDEEPKPNVTTEQVVEAYNMAAPFVSKVVLTAMAGGQHVRLAFLEVHADETRGLDIFKVRSAITMSIEQMLSLRNMISNMESNLATVTMKIGPDGKPVPVTDGDDGQAPG